MLKIFTHNINVFAPRIDSSKNNSVMSTSTFNAPRLKPLLNDCVSFTSRGKNQPVKTFEPQALEKTAKAGSKDLTGKERTISNGLAHSIYTMANRDTNDLKYILRKVLGPLRPQDGMPCDDEHPVFKLESRTKGANSIREKASQKFLYSKESVINNLHDLTGARIILGNGLKGGADTVIDALIDYIQSEGKLKIVEVENHIPMDKKFQYVSQTKLHNLAKASYKKFGTFASESITRNETGYTAIHILVEFPDGITGEIQILGKDVAIFKELEDIPYKILQGKAVHPEYEEIKEILKPLLPVDDNPLNPENAARLKLRNEFIAYTTAAYKHERKKGPSSPKERLIPEFLTINEFASTQRKKLHLTPDMDFNNLYKIKSAADARIKKNLSK